MSMLTIADLRRHSTVDEATGCWHYKPPRSGTVGKELRIYTIDYDRNEKRVISGPKSVWYIAHQQPLRGHKAMHSCQSHDCVNPVHVRRALNFAEIGLHVARSGKRRNVARTPAQLAHCAEMRRLTGRTDTPPDVVRRIRSAPKEVTGRALAAETGLSPQSISRIRNGRYYKDVTA
mgnify:CR=1 FL=1